MERIRLAYLVSKYPSISHTFILREVLWLREHGFEISVASVNATDRTPEGLTADEASEARRTWYIKDAGVPGALRAHARTLVRLPAGYFRGLLFALRLGGSDLRLFLKYIFYFVEAVMVGDWMRKDQLEHVHVHFATPAASVAMIAAHTFGTRFSVTVHGPDEFYDVSAYRLAEKIKAASFVCTIGDFARSQLMRLSDLRQWSKFEVCPLGVNPEDFRPSARRDNPSPFEILCVGRLVPAKGQAVLIEAVRNLVAEGRDVRLRLIGDGPDRSALEAYVKQCGVAANVVFEGALNQDAVRAFYRNADVFALASFAEGIPVVLMEAMAMEIPCVTTFIAGIPELIRNGIDGVLVAPGDDRELSTALAELMDDQEKRRRLGEAGRRRVMTCYDLTHNTAKLAAVFRKRLGHEA